MGIIKNQFRWTHQPFGGPRNTLLKPREVEMLPDIGSFE